ncbi:MAG: hypothetical protein WA659_04040 [Candidatus Aquirickettsiella sp.]
MRCCWVSRRLSTAYQQHPVPDPSPDSDPVPDSVPGFERVR